MGVVYKRKGNHEKAIEYYNKAKEMNPGYASIYLNLSAIYIEDKDYESSIEILNEGIKNNPAAHDLYYNRACSYTKLYKRDMVLKDMKTSLKLYPKLLSWFKQDKDFDLLRDDKEFISIIEEYSNVEQEGS